MSNNKIILKLSCNNCGKDFKIILNKEKFYKYINDEISIKQLTSNENYQYMIEESYCYECYTPMILDNEYKEPII